MSTKHGQIGEGGMRGYFGIGVERAKTLENLGTLWRSAACLGANFVFTVGDRYHRDPTDTIKSWRHLPYWRFDSWDDFRTPYDCITIGVELVEDAKPLERFAHPARCVYVLGPEDGSLSKAALERCQDVVRFSSRYCLNVAVAGSVVLYDRQAKRLRVA
jgi:tRNA (guanosine-2'-O-)-methyltransferase